MMDKLIDNLKNSMKHEIQEGILKFWEEKTIDHENGGFIGQILQDGTPIPQAPKAAILNTRILWTFSQAHRLFPNNNYKHTATRAYNYLLEHFYDKEKGGIYWQVDYKGKTLNTKKQIYAQAFAIYSLVEYHIATQNEEALEYAKKIYDCIEKYSFDTEENGYFEAYSRNWELLEDLRLSDKDQNEKKTMNTHLHILEAYTNLYSVWRDKQLEQQLQNLIRIFLDKIINNEYHFNLFMDEKWNVKSKEISFGHDIEGSWLLHEAAEVLGKPEIITEVKQIALRLAEITLQQGIDTDGGLMYEANEKGLHDTDKHWWVQAEAVVGFYNAWQISSQIRFLEATAKTWNFIDKNILDKQNGEWYWRVNQEGKLLANEDKVGPWKCPYHNSRMCFEIIRRIK